MLSLYYVQPVSRPKLIGTELTFFGALLSGLDITFPGGERYNNAAASSPTTQCWISGCSRSWKARRCVRFNECQVLKSRVERLVKVLLRETRNSRAHRWGQANQNPQYETPTADGVEQRQALKSGRKE